MECRFVVGQRVVCIKKDIAAFTRNCAGGNPGFEAGGIYTISWIGICMSGAAGLQFHEIPLVKNVHFPHHPPMAYTAASFAPLKEQSFWIGEKQDLKAPAEKERV